MPPFAEENAMFSAARSGRRLSTGRPPSVQVKVHVKMKYRCTLWRFKFTLGARDFSSAVSGFCQVFGQHLNFPPHARKTSGTQGSSNLLQNTSLPLRLPKYSKCYNKSSNGKKTRVSVNMSNLSSSACFLLRSKLRPSEVKIKIFR